MALTSAATAAPITPEALNSGMLTSSAAAAHLSRTPKTLANWRTTGVGPRYFRSGKRHSRVYYRVSDLNTWIDEQAALYGVDPADAAKAGE